MNLANSNLKLLTLTDEQGLREFVRNSRKQGKVIGFVPTMGALHEGHLSLARISKQRCDVTIASVYVNPTQFAPAEDLDKYPKRLQQDVELLEGVADAVFAPSDELIYPKGFSTFVQPPRVAQILESEFRPEHFRGVTTIVLKLFNLVNPDYAFFGMKDFQQLRVIESMVSDFNVPVQIVACPIIREQNGLALSSRNQYLNDEQKERALALSQTLRSARESIFQGETDGHALMAEMKQNLIDGGVSDIDYAVVANPVTLETMETIALPAILLVAAHVEQTRLIDNCLIEKQ